MTPLQRFLLILLGIISVSWAGSAVFYFLGGARGFPSFVFGLVVIPLFAFQLWNSVQQTRAGKGVPGLTPEIERRFIRDLTLSGIALLLVPVIIVAVLRNVVSQETVLLLSGASAVVVMLVPIVLAVRARRKR